MKLHPGALLYLLLCFRLFNLRWEFMADSVEPTNVNAWRKRVSGKDEGCTRVRQQCGHLPR